ESRMRENRTYGLKRRGLETERKPPRQSPTLLSGEVAAARCGRTLADIVLPPGEPLTHPDDVDPTASR
ncbi:hypothetical protein ACWGQ5_50740, partial [Streptomyces sp. NPDC055722]